MLILHRFVSFSEASVCSVCRNMCKMLWVKVGTWFRQHRKYAVNIGQIAPKEQAYMYGSIRHPCYSMSVCVIYTRILCYARSTYLKLYHNRDRTRFERVFVINSMAECNSYHRHTHWLWPIWDSVQFEINYLVCGWVYLMSIIGYYHKTPHINLATIGVAKAV